MNSHSAFLAAAGLMLAVSTAAFAQSPTSTSSSSSGESSVPSVSVDLASSSKKETNVRERDVPQLHEAVLRQTNPQRAHPVAQSGVTNMISGQSRQPLTTPSAMASSGPRVDAARAGVVVHVENPASATVAPVAPPPRVGQNVALMVVGGAALITGAVIGGDGGTLLAIGGAVVGLIGLYQYIK